MAGQPRLVQSHQSTPMHLIGPWLHIDYSLFLPLIPRLPLPVAYALADLRGALQFGWRRSARTRAWKNATRALPCLGHEEIKRAVLEHFQVQSRNEMEAFWYRRPASFFRRLVEISGLETLHHAIETGRGVLLFSGHFGSTGLFFTALGKEGIKMNVVGRSIDREENPLHPACLRYNRKRVKWIEEAVGNPFVLTGQGNYPLLRSKLQQGEVVTLLIDVPPTLLRRTVPVNFLGAQARFADGIASLFQGSGARLIHWTIQQPDGIRRQKIQMQDVTARVQDLSGTTEIMQRLVAILEERIRARPGHWLSWDSLEHFYDPDSARQHSAS